jgi:hypothetical protein
MRWIARRDLSCLTEKGVFCGQISNHGKIILNWMLRKQCKDVYEMDVAEGKNYRRPVLNFISPYKAKNSLKS